MKKAGVYAKYVIESVEVKRKVNEKAMKTDKIYEDYAVRGEDTYSIKISPMEV